jgi:guanosine-3',5'-bis(diphosphate) 3'-pyrophosphohydrolase
MNDVSILLKAIHFAADKHRDQRRKDVNASPYINHPIHVAQILSEVGVDDPEILAAAVLHDTVEDTETSLAELVREFGDRVARIVSEVTDDKSLSKADRKRLQIEHALELSEEGALVKIADKISNVADVSNNPPSDWDQSRRIEYLDWAERVVKNCPVVSMPLLEQFDLTLDLAKSAVDTS